MAKAGEKIDDAAEEFMHGGESALEKAGRKLDEAIAFHRTAALDDSRLICTTTQANLLGD